MEDKIKIVIRGVGEEEREREEAEIRERKKKRVGNSPSSPFIAA